MTGFTYWGTPLEYFDHEYNTTRLNERAVEVPIAGRFLDSSQGKGLELGNVMSHYRPISHRVVDRYEPGVENLDVFDLNGSFDWILAVSTLEHVRWDEDPKCAEGSGNAVRHLLGLLRPGGRMLVTVPFGWHPFFDSEILSGAFPADRACSLIRVGDGWKQTAEVEHRRYAESTIWAESVWIAEWTK